MFSFSRQRKEQAKTKTSILRHKMPGACIFRGGTGSRQKKRLRRCPAPELKACLLNGVPAINQQVMPCNHPGRAATQKCNYAGDLIRLCKAFRMAFLKCLSDFPGPGLLAQCRQHYGRRYGVHPIPYFPHSYAITLVMAIIAPLRHNGRHAYQARSHRLGRHIDDASRLPRIDKVFSRRLCHQERGLR